MKSQQILIIYLICTIGFSPLRSQNQRISNSNSIGWYNLFLTSKLNSKLSIHSEFQIRRNQILLEDKQKLFRLGLNYQSRPNVLLRGGYAFIETYAYGNLPLNAFGKAFSEHRAFQMVQLSEKEGIFNMTHRFMLEQRFIGRYSSEEMDKEESFPLTNRMRYMFRIQTPLLKNKSEDKFLYVAFYDEVFIGFGNNVNANIFDQNRIGALIGYKLDDKTRMEIGYLNQILQYGRELNNQSIFQYNNGIIFNINFDIDLSN